MKMIDKILRRFGYIKVSIAKNKVRSYKVKYEEALDDVTFLEMELVALKEQNKQLLINNSKLQKKIGLAEAVMKNTKYVGGIK